MALVVDIEKYLEVFRDGGNREDRYLVLLRSIRVDVLLRISV